MRIASVGHAFFAAVMIGLGVLGLVQGKFVPVWDPVPVGAPAREILIYLCAAVSLGSGIGLLLKRSAAPAARVLLGCLLFWFIAFRVRPLFPAPAVDAYWSACATAAIMAAAWVLFVGFATEQDKRRLSCATGERGMRIARVLYGLALLPFGLAHFQYLDHTAQMVPAWLPSHGGIACFTGWTFMAAGVAVLIDVWPRLAAALSAIQLGLFTLLVWGPVVLRGTRNAFQWSETLISVALTAAAWVVADSYRGTRWFAAKGR